MSRVGASVGVSRNVSRYTNMYCSAYTYRVHFENEYFRDVSEYRRGGMLVRGIVIYYYCVNGVRFVLSRSRLRRRLRVRVERPV